ncbi:DUF6044 family protein [Sulfurovum sp. NBC37-1]|uniref:DUF6044 family protein n=1 Tax=Sulfurovum sp. (strain NBC37-1) TaxID=387093 RepID=UPI0001587BDA|nr:DUF6044 family protein [Sulfurovum sp. NBC37-1]BAF73087.1 conserved hypothetical protein [Sulfurovum sp. NBC37-1]
MLNKQEKDSKQTADNRKIILFFIGFALVFIYLLPIFGHPLYVITFDNLDIAIPQAKILAESGKIFAPNSAIIPNMMNGLPRVSYGSEFNMLFWLYYFFDAEIAFRINFVLIHIVAYISMYLFLQRYFMYKGSYRSLIIVVASLFFAILPFYSGGGLTTSVLPLLLYILLNIRNGSEKPYEWLLLVLIPFYSSFILMYIFVLFYLWVAFTIDTFFIAKHFQKRLFLTLLLLTVLYAITEYRQFLSILDPVFTSHRTEFNVYFCETFRKAHIYAIKFFLDGWTQHQQSLMMPWLLPLSLSAMIFSTLKRRFTQTESMLIWLIILLSIIAGIWHDVLTNKYTLLGVSLLSVITIIRSEKIFKILGILMLLNVFIAIYNGLCFYEGLAFFKEQFHILNQFNISRAAFFQPVLVYLIVAFAFASFATYLKYFRLFIVIIIIFQFYFAMYVSRVSSKPNGKYMTLQQYYAPEIFNSIKKDLNITSKNISKYHFVEYGIEPSVVLYNGLYTVDGYSTNYPLSYKHKFKNVQQKECFNFMWGSSKMYETWGSKAYLLCIETRPRNYRLFKEHNITSYPFYASPDELCKLRTNFIISGIKLKKPSADKIQYVNDYNSTQSPWHLWVYRLNCPEKKGK